MYSKPLSLLPNSIHPKKWYVANKRADKLKSLICNLMSLSSSRCTSVCQVFCFGLTRLQFQTIQKQIISNLLISSAASIISVFFVLELLIYNSIVFSLIYKFMTNSEFYRGT